VDGCGISRLGNVFISPLAPPSHCTACRCALGKTLNISYVSTPSELLSSLRWL
jgi:hypothetical protein